MKGTVMSAKEFFPWCFGANFYPSTAINQLEMWQAETFDPETIDRELGYAENIGMGIMRVYLHDLLWVQDKDGFLKRMEEYLAIAERHGIKTMFTFFDDCWNPSFALGKQPDPKPFVHNSGWIQSPGIAAVDDLSQRPRLEEYIKGVISHFANDKRIAVWDLYNEPGNGPSGDHITQGALQVNLSLPLLKDVFKWAKEVKRSQPVTAGAWMCRDDFKDVNDFVFDQSELVTFHNYMPDAEVRAVAEEVIRRADGRQVLCSEYMSRGHNTFRHCLPLFRELNISAINWGLVSGKTQTIYPWGWTEDKGVPEFWFHDVFEKDGTLLYPEEKAVFDSVR
jgi:hypothetical protein